LGAAAAVLGGFSGDAVRLLGLRRAWVMTVMLSAAGTGALALAPGQVPIAAVAGVVFGGAYTALSGVLISWAGALRPHDTGRSTATLFIALTAGQSIGAVATGALAERIGAVCEVISSIFTEGHASATDTALIRGDLCEEAIWLAELLSKLVPNDPEVAGLHALLLLTDARRPSRLDTHGSPILLADQDRTLWDQPMIARGLAELARAHSFQRGGPFQFQAAIAALHATAPTFEATEWRAVLRLYDVLLQRQPSALVALNRAIAVDHVHGPAAALAALDAIPQADDLTGDVSGYVYFHTARADVLARVDRRDDAAAALDRAIECSTNESERSFLRRRRQDPKETVGPRSHRD